jgi:hypothetical protein
MNRINHKRFKKNYGLNHLTADNFLIRGSNCYELNFHAIVISSSNCDKFNAAK